MFTRVNLCVYSCLETELDQQWDSVPSHEIIAENQTTSNHQTTYLISNTSTATDLEPNNTATNLASNQILAAANHEATFLVSNIDHASESEQHPLLEACKCSSKKCSHVEEETRKRIHREFWRMPYIQRKQWIYSHVEQCQPTRRYVEPSDKERKPRLTRKYKLPVHNSQVRVCQVGRQVVFISLIVLY